MKKISKALLSRLPGYLEHLKSIPEENGEFVSSATVANSLGLGQALVRKDFSRVCDKGHPKLGYIRLELIADIEAFLGYNTDMDAVLVGTGKLGSALLDYTGFQKYGIHLVAGFDVNAETFHTEYGKPIYPVKELAAFCRENNIRMGVITVPAAYAQHICDQMVECGIQAIWNFAPIHLEVPKQVHVHNENLAVSLAELRMELRSLVAQENIS